MRAGPRSEQTELTLAVVDALRRRLAESPMRSVHELSKAVPTVSRSQLYLLMGGQAVFDLAELQAVCEALQVLPGKVLTEAEKNVGATARRHGRRRLVAAYDEGHGIEDEQRDADGA